MSDFAFPENALQIIADRVHFFLSDYEIVHRPVRIGDPAQTIGIYPENWAGLESSHETGQNEPTLQRYTCRLFLMVKHIDEREGRRMYSNDSKTIRAVLYRDTTLPLLLAELSDDSIGTHERFQRLGIGSQRFLGNELQEHGHVFTSTTMLWIETETVATPTP